MKKTSRRFYSNIHILLPLIWQAEKSLPYFLLQLPLLAVFYVAELFYRIGFVLVKWYNKIFVKPHTFSRPVIGVGNLTVGGTGKSVVVAYIATLLPHIKCGVVMRGYGGENEKKKEPFFVDKKSDVFVVGDEAAALAQSVLLPIVVCAQKIKALNALFFKTTVAFAVIDDAYQTWNITKTCNILLLDARAPLGNGHCLPAGPLREKDMTRASLIVVTHTNIADENKKEKVRRLVRKQCGISFLSEQVVWGSHFFEGIFDNEGKKVAREAAIDKRFYAVAGIGSPKQFFEMLARNGVFSCVQKSFPDHYDYASSDVSSIIQRAAGRPIVTTTKDWVKLYPLLLLLGESPTQWFVARVVFRPETVCDKQKILSVVKKTIGI